MKNASLEIIRLTIPELPIYDHLFSLFPFLLWHIPLVSIGVFVSGHTNKQPH